MTRRVRFTPCLRAGVFAAVGALASAPAWAGDVPFTTQPPISTTADGALAVFAADMDGDGDTDVLSASPLDSKVAWYENVAGDGSAWTIHTITTGDPASSVFAADVDGDGDVDVLSSSFADDKIAWYENTAGNGTAWTTRTITTAAAGATSVVAADVDGDGDLDALSSSPLDNKVAWYENTAGDGTAWTTHTITTSAAGATSVVAADVDGDGDVDVISSSTEVTWYENTAGDGSAWTPFTISTGSVSPVDCFAADVDGDGDEDVLEAFSLEAAWYENTAGNGTAWTLHTIATTAVDLFRSVSAADVDGDGDIDALFASESSVVWHENTAGDGSAWTSRTIASAVSLGRAVFSADLDGDGDADVLSASSNDDTIAWYRNDTIHESACFAAQPPIATGLGSPRGVAAADLDGDGDTDALAALFNIVPALPQVVWRENANGDGSVWTAHTITTGMDEVVAVVPADVDGDGDVDALSIGYYSGLRWHRNDAGNGSSWTTIPIGVTGFATAAADVDGDGDIDAITSTNLFNPFVHWWENVAGDGSSWTAHTIASFATTLWGASYSVAAADIDGDGDMDVLTHNGLYTAPGFWLENTAGNGSTWTMHTLPVSSPVDLVPADVDGDGDLDVVAGGAVWLENVAGNGSVWVTHTIGGSGYDVFVADADRDGDLDVFTASIVAPGLVWHENTAGNGSAWVSHPLPAGPDSRRGVVASDLDGDGDLDVLASSASGRLDWFENRGGQFSLAATDISPGGAMNGDVVPMLRVVATHLGRAGDGDLELATFGLLFEEAAGDPLTSAEANALIENLHVYRDANGNGNFDPGTDTLVATVPTLALVNGVQTVAFADGDPNLQVALGTPRTYFVVTELTGNASGQTPNQFQVTHLGTGPAASTAEDRTYDIPLRPACPADVTAAVGPVTPVELLGFSVE